MKNPFLVSLGHEIQAPMNSLIGVTESLLETDLTADQRRMAEAARGAAQALLEVLNDMVVLSGIRDGRMSLERVNFDLVGMIETVARLYTAEAQQCGLELVCRIDDQVPKIAMGDPGRLRQVLATLIGNAVKYTEAGQVVLGVTVEPGSASSTRLRFSVRDSGTGIPAGQVHSILHEPGPIQGSAQDSRWSGEGYGLAIAQLILVLMGSRLEIESEVGKGSLFEFVLELGLADSGAGDAFPDDWLHLEGARVLVVGGSQGQCRMIEEVLGCAGVLVDAVEGGRAALAALSASGSGNGPYQMVIIDSYLPGTGCFELAREIRGLNGASCLPLMVLRSGGQPGDGERCRAGGISAYLSKPVSRIELLQAAAILLACGAGSLPNRLLVTRYSMEESRRTLRILMVDDSPVNRQVVAAMLHRRGHRVDAFSSVSDAMQAGDETVYDAVMLQRNLQGQGLPAEGDAPVVITLVNPGPSGGGRAAGARSERPGLVMPPDPMALFAAVEQWGITASSTDRAEPEPQRNPVDLVALRTMMRDAGIEDAVDTILQIFINESPAWMSALSEAALRGDAAGMAKAAHVFRSAAGSVKANDLFEALSRIEETGNRGDAAAAARLVQQAGSEYQAVGAFLNMAGTVAPLH